MGILLRSIPTGDSHVHEITKKANDFQAIVRRWDDSNIILNFFKVLLIENKRSGPKKLFSEKKMETNSKRIKELAKEKMTKIGVFVFS